jgi:ribose transport system permease protein
MNQHEKKISINAFFQPQYGLIWVLFIMLIIFSFFSEPFRSIDNLLEILRQSGIMAIMVVGLTWIVATGEIDVSFPNVVSFATIITAFCLKSGLSWEAACLLAVIAGTMFGVISGFLVVFLKFPSLIATIATMTMARSIASIISSGKHIHIGRTGGFVYELVYGTVYSIPILFLITVGIYLICRYLQDSTTTGQHLYALGENRQATLEAGIKERKILMSFFILSATLSAFGGVLLTAQLNSGNPNIGGKFFIDGMTVVFLGAMIIKAGQPNVIGTLIGVIILSVLSNGLTMLGIPFYVGTIIKGVLLVFGIVVVTFAKYQRRGEQLQVV